MLVFSSSAERSASSAPICPITGAQSMTYWWILSAASQISFGAQRKPTRQPVIAYALENPLSVIVRCQRSFTVAAAVWVDS